MNKYKIGDKVSIKHPDPDPILDVGVITSDISEYGEVFVQTRYSTILVSVEELEDSND